MNVLIQLSHPAHFHLYKIVAQNLIDDGHKVLFVIKSKDILEELLKNGTTTLRAETREKLDEMVQTLPADVRVAAGIVARNRESGEYVLQVDIIKE